MKIRDLSREQVMQYFEIRLPNREFKHGTGDNYQTNCPFPDHEDRKASFSFNTAKASFKCFGCNREGGLIDFEAELSHCDKQTALMNIAAAIGEKQMGFGSQPEKIYQYHDAQGRVLFEKLRFPGKDFRQRKPDGKGGWIYKLGGTPKPLYHLPEVITANYVIACEGEKDADNVRALCLSDPENGHFVAATCNFDGAGKWSEAYSIFFAGKTAVIFADNDDAGRKHALLVARSIWRYTKNIKIVEFPELPPKGDVSDFLAKFQPNERRQALVDRVQKTPPWVMPKDQAGIVVEAGIFAAMAHPEITWLVDGLIEAGTNGILIARPKASKSFISIDLAIAIASGQQFLERDVASVKRTLLVSREDAPHSTAWRSARLCEGRGLHPADLSQNLFFSTKAQKPMFRLDEEIDLAELLDAMQAKEIEFLILDVFRVMHSAKENDNDEMQRVMDKLSLIQSKTKAQIMLIHHDNKGDAETLTERARGASAIMGWAEWVWGIGVADQETKPITRELRFELKAIESPKPIYYQICDRHLEHCPRPDPATCSCPRVLTRMERIDPNWEAPKHKRRSSDW